MTPVLDNITPLKSSDHVGTPSVDGGSSSGSNVDLSKIAIVVSLLSVVLSVIFFFGLNRNLSGLSNEVKDIGVIRNNVEALDSYVDDILAQMGRVNTRIMELEEKPRKEAVRVFQESMIDDMLRRSEFMKRQLSEVAPEDSETANKLARLQILLQEFSTPQEEAVPFAPSAVPLDASPTERFFEDSSSEQEQASVPKGTLMESEASNPSLTGPVDDEPTHLVPAPPLHQFVPAPEDIPTQQ